MQLRTVYEKNRKRYDLNCVAGENGMSNDVRWVHVLEDIDTAHFIRGNELIITTGVCSKDSDWEEWLLKLLETLRGLHACGVIVNLGRYIPHIPQSAIDFAARHSFPVIVMPWKMRIVDVERDFSQLIFEDSHTAQNLIKAFLAAFYAPGNKNDYVPYLSANGFGQNAKYCVLNTWESGGLIADVDRISDLELYISNKFNRRPIVYHMFCNNDKMCLILRDPSGHDEVASVAETILAACWNKMPDKTFRIGIGDITASLDGLHKSYERSLLALSYCKLTNKNVAFFERMGLYRMLLSINDENLLREMLNETLGKLIEYDKDNGTNLIETLKLYIINGFSVREVSNQTYLHRNTINYRIRKIKEIMKNEMETMDEKLNILLAFYIYEILA